MFIEIFVIVYGILSFGYLLFRYLFSTIYSVQSLKEIRIKYPKVSIIIPCYNEEPKYLTDCIVSSCTNSYPSKEIIVIDDGSSNKESWKTIKKLQEKYHFKAIQFKQNKGKRQAMYAGFKASTGDYIITMDSDSIITNGQSLKELINPFRDRTVGAVSGNVQVLNKDDSLMAKIQWARYWLAFNIEKAAQSPYNAVTCCSGPFSAYRRQAVMKILDEWINQVFLGQKCTYGDDRGLTTLILREGYKVKFSKYAMSLTNVPTTFKQFIKQQIRWKKSFVRENYYLSKFILKKNPIMQLEFFWFWAVFIMGFIAKGLAIYMLITGQSQLIMFAIMIIFVAMLHYIYCFIRSFGRRGYYGLLYGFLNEFVVSWLFWWALFKLKETKWGTR